MANDVQQGDAATLFEAVIAQAYNAVVITDADLVHGGPRITFANPAFCALTGYALDELIGRSPRMLQGPATDRRVIDDLRDCLHAGRFFEGETVNYRKDGTPYHVRWNISPVRDRNGRITHFVSVQQDTTERVAARRERDLLARALDSASEVIVLFDADGRFVHVNAAAEHTLGYPAGQLVGRPFNALRAQAEGRAERWEELVDTAEPVRSVVELQRADGQRFHFERSLTPIRDPAGAVTHYVSVGTDVSDRVREQRYLRERAERDALTGGLQRAAGDEALHDLIVAAKRERTSLAVMACDIDHFKDVNDTHGHLVGDRVLRLVASALRSQVRGSDVLVRWGGEEFLLLLPTCDADAAVAKAEQVRAAVAEASDPSAGQVTVSVGLAMLWPDEDAQSVVRRADEALYRAKRGGRNRVERAPP